MFLSQSLERGNLNKTYSLAYIVWLTVSKDDFISLKNACIDWPIVTNKALLHYKVTFIVYKYPIVLNIPTSCVSHEWNLQKYWH